LYEQKTSFSLEEYLKKIQVAEGPCNIENHYSGYAGYTKCLLANLLINAFHLCEKIPHNMCMHIGEDCVCSPHVNLAAFHGNLCALATSSSLKFIHSPAPPAALPARASIKQKVD
jgi:hypothetical protein